MVIIDTSIIIEHLRLPNNKKSTLIKLVQQKPKEALAISVVTIQELYEGQSTKNKNKEQSLLATIAPLKILPYTFEIAQFAGKIARDIKKPIEMADAAIAATTILNNDELVTLNKKDFLGIKDLKILTI
jgi:predicted nucleic acid-binding protein